MKSRSFQNYVILDSNKTAKVKNRDKLMFQNYVILDSNKTGQVIAEEIQRFRIMLFQIVIKHK